MKRLLFSLLALIVSQTLLAQKYVVTGSVEDERNMNKLEFASATLMKLDSTKIIGTMTDSIGAFKLRVAQPGAYILRVSFVGYSKADRMVTLTENNDSIDLGIIGLVGDKYTLQSAVVTGTAARVQQVGDTTMFNASAYRTPTGSTLESLVKQLPGVEVSDDGTIKWNGKTVKSFLVNGKDFFKGDTKVAMKNLPTEMVSKLKAYDKKSDYTEQTGIDDGEETTVLDIMTKRELNESWIVNADLGWGNKDRYAEKFFATRFSDNSRISLFGSLNNTGDEGFGGPRGFGRSNGLTSSKMFGLDFEWENGKKKREAGRLELGGNVRYSHTGVDLLAKTNSEIFLTSGSSSSFANSLSRSFSSSTYAGGELKLEWSPDSMTYIDIRPTFSHSDSHNSSKSRSATFKSDPYGLSGSPLDSIFAANPAAAFIGIAVNRSERLSKGSSVNNSVGGSMNIIRRLGSNGRNVSFRANYNYSQGHSSTYSISDIQYYNGKAASFLNQYSWTPNKNYNYGLRFGYSEPFAKNWNAQVRYEYSFRYQDSDRSRYNLNEIDSLTWGNPLAYPPLGTLPTEAQVLQAVRDDYNSQYATYRYFNNSVNLGVRYNNKIVRFDAGVSFNPQRTKLAYERPGQNIDTTVVRKVFNVSPQMRFRYQFSKTNQFEFNYRGSASQPSMTNLLDVVDDSNPLLITMGNPGLKPSWVNTLQIQYRGYNPEQQAGMFFGFDFTQTSNAISTRIVYDDATGVRYSRPENIDGIWSMGAHGMYNFGFGKNKVWTLSSFTNFSFNHDVGYVSRVSGVGHTRRLVAAYLQSTAIRSQHNTAYYNNVFSSANAEKNVNKTLSMGEHLRLNYRASFFDAGFIGMLNYQHSRNSIQTSSNLNTWQFSYGAEANFNAPWGMSLSTDIRMSSRRGYSVSSMNTNELLWNAQLSQSFLKKKNLTLSVQFYDILQQQSNISRVLNAQMRSDSWNNAINSYFMVHLIYKLNIFPGGSSSKDADAKRDGEWKEGRGGRPGPGGRPGGGRPGGGPGPAILSPSSRF